MTDDKRDEIDALVGAYALDAVNDEERAAVAERLAESDELRAEATGLGDTAVALGLALAPEAPPASLKDSIFAQLDATPQLPAPLAVVEAAEVEPESTSSVEAEPAVGGAEGRAHRRWFNRPLTGLIAAAAAVAIIAGGVAVGSGALAPQVGYEQIIAASDAQSASADIPGGGTATLHWSGEKQRAALSVTGMPAAPDGKTYELWYIDGKGTATPAGTFSPADQTTHTVVLDGKMSAGDTVGVTIEPEGGSTKPTTDPMIAIGTA